MMSMSRRNPVLSSYAPLVVSGALLYALIITWHWRSPYVLPAPLVILCVVLFAASVFLAARRTSVPPNVRAPQWFTTDLLSISFVVAVYLAYIQRLYPDNVTEYGLLGMSALVLAMLRALANASRQGYVRGWPRHLLAIGSTLSILGGGALFLWLTFCTLIAWRLGYWRLQDMIADRSMRSYVEIVLFAMPAFVGGQIMCAMAQRPRLRSPLSATAARPDPSDRTDRTDRTNVPT